MGSKTRTRVIKCPVQNRLVEVTYKAIGSWFNREYDVVSCPAMNEWGDCDHQCKNQLVIPPNSAEWYSRY
jgi:hypothetical protein